MLNSFVFCFFSSSNFSAVLYTLSKQAKALSANKLHLQVNNRLQTLKIPEALQDQVDVSLLAYFRFEKTN